MSPFVSVITVSLNAAKTIEDTIASVSMQKSDFALEHVCVDGGSVDSTRQIIDRWAARSDRIVRIYEPDAGIFDAMNKGLHAALGEYVLYLNADDYLASATALATALRQAAPGASGNPDLILGDVLMGEAERVGIWRRRSVPRLLGRHRGLGFFPIHQGVLAKRSLLQGIGGFDANLRLASDVNVFYDLERRFTPSMRITGTKIAFMRKGGSANASPKAIWLGTSEIYRHLRKTHGIARAAGMVLVKTMQSASELRYGRCPQDRWFAAADSATATAAATTATATVTAAVTTTVTNAAAAAASAASAAVASAAAIDAETRPGGVAAEDRGALRVRA